MHAGLRGPAWLQPPALGIQPISEFPPWHCGFSCVSALANETSPVTWVAVPESPACNVFAHSVLLEQPVMSTIWCLNALLSNVSVTKYAHLVSPLVQTMQQFFWQEDMQSVVHLIRRCLCMKLPAAVAASVADGSSNQP